LGSRKSPRGAATVATESTPTSTPPRLTTEERRRRILEGLEKMDDQGIRRVDWFVQAILEDDPVLLSLASARVEEEPLTEEDLQALAESDAEMKRGEYLTHEEVRRLWLGEQA
jgi:hypothetical protein